MASILVTGGTGFVGQHLIAKLYDSLHNVKAVVRKVPCTQQSSITYTVIDDMTPVTDWSEVLQGIEIIIHLAARAHILRDTDPDPLKAFQLTNVDATLNLAKQAIDSGVKQFIFISSIGAMASLSDLPLQEMSICQPDTPYGVSKLRAEVKLTEMAKHTPRMNVTILRPTLVYGPGNPGNMERLMRLIDRGLPIPLGAITNKRSLLFVENLVDGILQCVNNSHAFNQCFVICDGEDVSTPELITYLSQSLQQKNRLLSIPPNLLKLVGQLTGKSDTIDRLTGSLIVDSSKIRQTLNWKPPYTFQEGIQKTCDWYLESRKT